MPVLPSLVSAFGTIIVSILAIWGGLIRAWLTGPKFSVATQPVVGGTAIRLSGGKMAIYVLLVVTNRRPYAAASKCRIDVIRLQKSSGGGTFEDEYLAFPITLYWSPSEDKSERMIHSTAIADLVRVEQGGASTILQAKNPPNDFSCNACCSQSVKYTVQVFAENALPSPTFTFEIAWDGNWDNDVVVMRRQHLIVSSSPA
jgi:hypothetical protein